MAAKEKTGELEIIRKLPYTSRGTSGRRRASFTRVEVLSLFVSLRLCLSLSLSPASFESRRRERNPGMRGRFAAAARYFRSTFACVG